MTNPDNARLLADEKGALEAENQLARDEQKLWQRFEATQSDALERRSQTLATKLAQLEQSSPSPELARLKMAFLPTAAAAVAAGAERGAALQARRASLQARELAVKALSLAVSQMESGQAARTKELDQAEQTLVSVEKGAKAAAEAAARQQQDAQRRATEEAARVEAARLAREREETIRREREVEARTAPELPKVSAPDPKTDPTTAPVAAAKLAVQAPATMSAGTLKKLSRRRRVKLAPPPRKMEVEVATFGENTFYTGFDQTIQNGGLFVASLETLPAGQEVDLEIDLEGRKINARGKVEFVRQDNLANPECTQGAGFKLLNLSRDGQSSIEAFFRRRAPMFFMSM